MIVYPDSSSWPANILRVQAATASAFGASGDFQILDESGTDLHAFADFPDGLWSPCGQVRTLLLHPGRIKRGLASSANGFFDPGASYQLSWRSPSATAGQGVHRFTAGLPIRGALTPDRWKIEWAPAGSLMPVRISPGDLLDVVSASAHLHFQSGRRRLDVACSASRGELHFAPKERWPADLCLTLDTSLEDVCGNRILSPFEFSAPHGQTGSGSRIRAIRSPERSISKRASQDITLSIP